jgi:hypothetical protein
MEILPRLRFLARCGARGRGVYASQERENKGPVASSKSENSQLVMLTYWGVRNTGGNRVESLYTTDRREPVLCGLCGYLLRLTSAVLLLVCFFINVPIIRSPVMAVQCDSVRD